MINGGSLINTKTIAALAAANGSAETDVGIISAVTNSGTIEAVAAASGTADTSIDGGNVVTGGTFTNIGAMKASAASKDSDAELNIGLHTKGNSLTNSGTMAALASAGGQAFMGVLLDVSSANLTNAGSGTIEAVATSGGTADGTISPEFGSNTLTNLGTIVASATGGSTAYMELEFGGFATDSIINFGTIAARATAKSYAEADVYGGSVVNAGTIEALANSAGASPHGAFVYLSGTVNNTSGLILASETGGSAAVDINSATISGGMLKTSGAQAAIYANGAFVGGVMIAAGSLIEETSGAALMLDSATIGSGAIVETASGGTAIVSGSVSNSGTLFASGSGSLVEIVNGAVVSGGVAEVGNGVVEITGSSGENVRFLSGGSGGLEIADTQSHTSAFSGRVSGFGGSGHSNQTQFIDLISVTSALGAITSSYVSGNAGNTSGTLFVSSGGHLVAAIELVGAYSAGDFHVTSGISSTVAITDPGVVNGGSVEIRPAQAFPQHGIDLPDIAFGAQTTLAYSGNSIAPDDSLGVTDARHAATIALLGNYMAGSFATQRRRGRHIDFGTPQPEQQSLLTHPPHG